MPAILPLPPPGVDPQSEEYRRYLLSLEDALTGATAPADAQYWVSTASAELTNDRNFGALATGYVKSTVAAGVSTPSTVASVPGADVTGAALTKTDDTNVTLALGGTPLTALLRAVSLTLGWTGLLGLARGGTNANLSATGGASQVLKQTSAGAAVTVGTVASSDLSDASNVPLKNGTNAFTGANSFPAGGGSSTVIPTGRVASITAAVSTTGTVEEVLATYAMPANTLNANGQSLRITGTIKFTSSGSNKAAVIRVGGLAGTGIATRSTATSGSQACYFDALITRRTSTTGYGSGVFIESTGSGNTQAESAALTNDFTTAIDIVITGITAVAGELTLQTAVFEYLG